MSSIDNDISVSQLTDEDIQLCRLLTHSTSKYILHVSVSLSTSLSSS
jgi:hypothetical protein